MYLNIWGELEELYEDDQQKSPSHPESQSENRLNRYLHNLSELLGFRAPEDEQACEAE